MAKKAEEDIDEDFIIASMNMTGPSGSNKIKTSDTTLSQNTLEQENHPVIALSKEEKESKKRKSKGNYETLFIRPADIAGRQEKTVYLREKHYERIDKILKLYNNTRLSVFSYVDAVLEHHFEVYNQDIKEIHDKLYTAPYE